MCIKGFRVKFASYRNFGSNKVSWKCVGHSTTSPLEHRSLSGVDKNTTHWTPSYNRRINQLIDEEEDNRGKDEARSRQINQLKEDEEEERRKYKKGKKRRRGQKKMQFTRQDW